jgi:glycosyltransferase involved in cell wall biosynthesis
MSGLPVVANNTWSLPEIVKDGETGFLAKANDVNDWADKLIQLIKSDELRQKMGSAAREFVKNKFTWEKNIQIHLRVYESLIR